MPDLKKSLKAAATSMTAQLPIMTDREKGETEDLIGTIVTVRDYVFLTGDNGDYAVFIVDEEPKQFFFAGLVLTKALKNLEDQGYHAEIVSDGLPMVLTKKKSKNKNKQTYVNVMFYPESAD